MSKARLFTLSTLLLAGMVGATLPKSARSDNPHDVEVIVEDGHEFSRPLRDVEPTNKQTNPPREIPLGRPHPGAGAIDQLDPVVQKTPLAAAPTTIGQGFDGVGVGFSGPQGRFVVNAAPPDTNGAVGATQYVQWVNESFAVFDKATESLITGPIAGNSLWAGFGGGCEQNNDGDPIVKYDQIANRWIFTQLSVSTTPYTQCIAVSTTSDATGSFNRYAFSYGNNFNDYPKLAVWPDAYYISFNMFLNGQSFEGSQVCAYDRAAMIAGGAATQQCFQLSSAFGGLLPSDLDAATLPPAGSPDYALNFGNNTLNLWAFHVDWANPANSTFTGPTSIP